MSAAAPLQKRIAKEWRAIPHSSTNPAASTVRGTSSFAAPTCPVCVVANRSANGGRKRTTPTRLKAKRSERESCTSAQSASELKGSSPRVRKAFCCGRRVFRLAARPQHGENGSRTSCPPADKVRSVLARHSPPKIVRASRSGGQDVRDPFRQGRGEAQRLKS
jgi:hypothetical protein